MLKGFLLCTGGNPIKIFSMLDFIFMQTFGQIVLGDEQVAGIANVDITAGTHCVNMKWDDF